VFAGRSQAFGKKNWPGFVPAHEAMKNRGRLSFAQQSWRRYAARRAPA